MFHVQAPCARGGRVREKLTGTCGLVVKLAVTSSLSVRDEPACACQLEGAWGRQLRSLLSLDAPNLKKTLGFFWSKHSVATGCTGQLLASCKTWVCPQRQGHSQWAQCWDVPRLWEVYWVHVTTHYLVFSKEHPLPIHRCAIYISQQLHPEPNSSHPQISWSPS